MNRRHLISLLLATPLWRAGAAFAQPSKAPPAPAIQKLQAEWRSYLPPNAQVPAPAPPLSLSDADWKKRLTPAQYRILRKEATERAGSSPLNEEKRRGIYACAGCGLPLFTSDMKFESGTGWPSFFTTIPGVFGTKTDHYLIFARTEYHCARCGGHHGHVFDDGPPPTMERWCNNGDALAFVPASSAS